jgi:16S rRNA (guanine966-N2)-methyltransferase
MRVVAGSARGRRLRTPSGNDVRPTADRVREAVFNALGSLDVVADAHVLDLFAGSGALGIEALSRGARHVTFVDRSPRAIEAVRANLADCGLADRATVLRADALEHLGDARHSEPVDLALLDPPYAFDEWPALLAAVHASVVVIESDRAVATEPHYEVRRERRYGGTVVTIAAQADRDDHGRRPPEDRS